MRLLNSRTSRNNEFEQLNKAVAVKQAQLSSPALWLTSVTHAIDALPPAAPLSPARRAQLRSAVVAAAEAEQRKQTN